jgi:hypothetical protein
MALIVNSEKASEPGTLVHEHGLKYGRHID